MDTDMDQAERKHFIRIVNAFKSYRKFMLQKIYEKEDYIKELPKLHQTLLRGYQQHLEEQKIAIEHNAEIIRLILKDIENIFENAIQHEIPDSTNSAVLTSDLEKVQSTLKHIVRDWSSAGEKERTACYGPIIEKIEQLFAIDDRKEKNVHILVPGAGLGRLAYEIAKRGFICQGNEFSLFMLFASNFVLNRSKGINTLHVYPWIYSGCNVEKNEHQLQRISFPDAEPSDLSPTSQFSMGAGDFLEIYTTENAWDCVATCFFIDCANNVVSFLETIYNILKPGGYWINLGPLLYHFSDQIGEKSIEPSYENLREIITGLGFQILEEKTNLKTTYTQDEKSMLSYEYSSVFFVAQKPAEK